MGVRRASGTGQALPTGSGKAQLVEEMFDRIAPRYDLVNRLMTFGLDRRWRHRTVQALGLPAGAVVADLACGTGDLCTALTKGELAPIGFDVSAGMLSAADTAVPLVRADVARLPVPDDAFDGATCGFALRNFVDLQAFLAELARVVHPGGRIALLDVAAPSSPVLRVGHRLYFNRVVPWIGAALSDGAAYRYLPESVAYLPPPGALVDAVRAAGFPDANRRTLSGGIVQLFVGTRA